MKANKNKSKSMRSHTQSVSGNEQGGNNFMCFKFVITKKSKCYKPCSICKPTFDKIV